MDWRIALGFAGIVLCTVCGNLLLKSGAMVPAADRVVLGILSYQSLAGLVLFAVGGLAYAVLLRTVPLNFAQVMISTQYVGVILMANLVFGEAISGVRWAGIACTMLGVALVGATAQG